MSGGRIYGNTAVSQNYADVVSGGKSLSNGKSVPITLKFSPSDVGAQKQKDKNYPPTVKLTENEIETALLEHFGFKMTDGADQARVRELLQTEGKSV